jgi:hypothetical protein
MVVLSAKNDGFISANIKIALYKFIQSDKITFYHPYFKRFKHDYWYNGLENQFDNRFDSQQYRVYSMSAAWTTDCIVYTYYIQSVVQPVVQTVVEPVNLYHEYAA